VRRSWWLNLILVGDWRPGDDREPGRSQSRQEQSTTLDR
jgi:hypothetical protein